MPVDPKTRAVELKLIDAKQVISRLQTENAALRKKLAGLSVVFLDAKTVMGAVTNADLEPYMDDYSGDWTDVRNSMHAAAARRKAYFEPKE